MGGERHAWGIFIVSLVEMLIFSPLVLSALGAVPQRADQPPGGGGTGDEVMAAFESK